MNGVRGRRWRRLAIAVAVAGGGAAGASLAGGAGSVAATPARAVKPLDRNVWIVHGPIDPDTQRFCTRSIASIVPADDVIYVICDSRGRLGSSRVRH